MKPTPPSPLAAKLDFKLQYPTPINPGRKPVEVSLARLGQAQAKGTGLPWVDPRPTMFSPRYAQSKRAIPVPPMAIADDTAAPLTAHLAQWLEGKMAPPPTTLADILGPLLR